MVLAYEKREEESKSELVQSTASRAALFNTCSTHVSCCSYKGRGLGLSGHSGGIREAGRPSHGSLP